MKREYLERGLGCKCDIAGCDRKAVAGNGVGGRLCSYHI